MYIYIYVCIHIYIYIYIHRCLSHGPMPSGLLPDVLSKPRPDRGENTNVKMTVCAADLYHIR